MKKTKKTEARRTTTNEEILRGDPDPIHRWFGLTYANYLVLPRAALQSMPAEWQEKFVALLEEGDEAYRRSGISTPRYRVHAVDERGRFVVDPIPHYRHAPNIFTRKGRRRR